MPCEEPKKPCPGSIRKNDLIKMAKDCNIAFDERTATRETLCAAIISKAKTSSMTSTASTVSTASSSDDDDIDSYELDYLEKPDVEVSRYSPSALYAIAGLLYFHQRYPEACIFGPILEYDIDNSLFETNFESDRFKKCLEDPGVRFIVGIIILMGRKFQYSHANSFIYDRADNSLEVYEPHGEILLLKKDEVNNFRWALQDEFGNLGVKNVYYSTDFCPAIGHQAYQDQESEGTLWDVGGFCLAWSLWWIDFRLRNSKSKKTRDQLIKTSIDYLNKHERSLTQFITNYSAFLYKVLGNILGAPGGNIDFEYYDEVMDRVTNNRIKLSSKSLKDAQRHKIERELETDIKALDDMTKSWGQQVKEEWETVMSDPSVKWYRSTHKESDRHTNKVVDDFMTAISLRQYQLAYKLLRDNIQPSDLVVECDGDQMLDALAVLCAKKKDNTKLLDMIYTKFGCKPGEIAMENAVMTKNVKVLAWAADKDIYPNFTGSIQSAIELCMMGEDAPDSFLQKTYKIIDDVYHNFYLPYFRGHTSKVAFKSKLENDYQHAKNLYENTSIII